MLQNDAAQDIDRLFEGTDFAATLFECMVDCAIIAAKFDGSIIAYNEGARRIYGYDAEEILGKSNVDIFFPRDFSGGGHFPEVIDALVAAGRFNYEGENVRKGGSRFPAQILLAVTKDQAGKVVGFLEIVQDLTERKAAEAQRRNHRDQLAQANEELQLEKLERTRAELELHRSMKTAELANRATIHFWASMSHELRTPMNSIIGFTERLIRKVACSLTERERDALQAVDRNAKHLLGLINNILDLCQIEAGRTHLEPSQLDLVALVREAAEEVESLADNKAIALRLELPSAPLMFEGDPTLLKQAVLNLLSNAIHHTDVGTVTITAGEADDAALGPVVRIAVRDTSVGIKPEEIPHLFQQFSQLDGSVTRKIRGTGLGLAISAHCVRMHGGRIDVVSEYGRGAELRVMLPLSKGAREPDPVGDRVSKGLTQVQSDSHSSDKGSAAQPSTKGIRILCVDDEPDTLRFLQLTFEDAGYEVLRAGDHDAAIEGAKTGSPDLICLDLCMPAKDGYEVLKSLRADPDLLKVPVIIVSATSEEARASGCGVNRYLCKPVDADHLLGAVREVLASRVGSALVIENNRDTSLLLTGTLTDHGLTVRTAANGREGLERLAESIPAVILLDLMMPVMDGFTFLEHVQRNPAWSQIPVIILTAKNLDAEEVARVGRASAAILTKGRGDTRRVVEAILKAVRPQHEVPEAVAT